MGKLKGSAEPEVKRGPGRPRSPKNVTLDYVFGHDLQVVGELILDRAAEGLVPLHVMDGFYNGDAAWMVVFG